MSAASSPTQRIPWANEDVGIEGGDGEAAGGEGVAASSHEKVITDPEMDMLEKAAKHLPFKEIVDRFDKVEATKGGETKRTAFFDKPLVNTLKDIRERLDGKQRPNSLYPIMRLLLPDLDQRQGHYKLQSNTIAKLYIAALGLPSDSEDANRLTNFSNPKYNKNAKGGGKAIGDIGRTIEEVLESRVSSQYSKYLIKNIEEFLDEVMATKADRERKELFGRMLNTFNAKEHKWLVRIILGDNKMGFKKDQALKIFGEDGPSRLQTSFDLRKICAESALGITAASKITLGTAFEPHLATKAGSPSQALATMDGQPFVMERKVDGERFMCHKRGASIDWISRNRKSAPDHYHNALDDYIRDHIRVENVILDGEIVAWNGDKQDHERFGHNKTYGIRAANGLPMENKDDGLMYVIFDIVHLAGEGAETAFEKANVEVCKPHEIASKPLGDRRALIRAIMTEQKHRLELIEHQEVNKGDHAERLEHVCNYYQAAVEKGWEGLVLKSLKKPYMPGAKSRQLGGWVKLKPDYGDKMEDLDLVVIGGYYREGELWKGFPSRFLFGVIADSRRVDDSEDEDEDEEKEGGGNGAIQSNGGLSQLSQNKQKQKRPSDKGLKLHTFAKVAGGLDTDQRDIIRNKLEQHWVEGGPGKPQPKWLVPWKAAREDIPAVWIHPYDSVILQIRSAEIIPSKSFTLNYTLRFPRVDRIRDDKSPTNPGDILTESEFRKIKDMPRRVYPSGGDLEGGLGSRGGRRGAGFNRKGKAASDAAKKKRAGKVIVAAYQTISAGDVEVKGHVFQGKGLVVLTGDYKTDHPYAAEVFKSSKGQRHPTITKMDIERLITEQGGAISAGLIQKKKEEEEESPDFGTSHDEEEGDEGGGNAGGRGSKKRARPKKAKKKRKKVEKVYEQDYVIGPTASTYLLTTICQNNKEIDVLTVDWIINCVMAGKVLSSRFEHLPSATAAGKVLSPRFEHILSATAATQKRLDKVVDCWGDPLTSEGTVLDLSKIFDRMSEEKSVPDVRWRHWAHSHLTTPNELDCLSSTNLFWRSTWVFYVDRYEDVGSPEAPEVVSEERLMKEMGDENGRMPLPFTTLDATAALMRLQGAVISSTLHADVAIIVVDRHQSHRFPMLLERLRVLRNPPYEAKEKVVVDQSWVEECAQACCILDREARHLVSLKAMVDAITTTSTPTPADDDEDDDDGL